MSGKVNLSGNRLTIELSEVDAKILEKTFPIALGFIKMYTTMTARLMLTLATLGKENLQSAIHRVSEGEDPTRVAVELFPELTRDPAVLFGDIEMPPDKEILKLLGMSDDTNDV